jgi:methylase of polypeptide subunit release factors
MLKGWTPPKTKEPLRVIDPAAGEGALLAALLKALPKRRAVEVYGFDTNSDALNAARSRLEGLHPRATLHLSTGDFLAYVLNGASALGQGELFETAPPDSFDLVIANPPYVRTQVLGASIAQALAGQFGLTGRVDLYHAFVLAIAKVLRPHGMAGIIVSNRFMTTKAGATVRRAARERLDLKHIWDLGDTKIFDAAVLPAVLVAEGLNGAEPKVPAFTSIYENSGKSLETVDSVIAALDKSGVVTVPDGRCFQVLQGTLDTSNEADGVWRVATKENDAWLATVKDHTWATFRDLGKVRVGVKTCADKVFIRRDWRGLPESEQPELLRPLTTHHIGRRYRADAADTPSEIVYPHETVNGKKRAVNLDTFPQTLAYLAQHRDTLQARSYVIEAGRNWYEIWVPQNPDAWSHPKLVFRDISEEPCFWIDLDGTIVNGDCYWLTCDTPEKEELLWLAVAVGNSTFIEVFYDHKFNNKLYAGRRRFITQYVEKFPLPDPATKLGKKIIKKSREAYTAAGTPKATTIEKDIDHLIWEAFGLPIEEVNRQRNL